MCLVCVFIFTFSCFAQEISSKEYVAQAWKILSKKDYDSLDKLVKECVDKYGQEADSQEASLKDFPAQDKISLYQSLNDVATCLFVRIEALVRQAKNEEAKQACRDLINKYPFAQAWDPRGWYWKVAEKAQSTLDKLEKGIAAIEEAQLEPQKEERKTTVVLHDPGKEEIINYEKYGEFTGIGTADYKYIIKNQEGLAQAAGEGIYPNTTSVRWNPNFNKAKEEGRLKESHWDLVHSKDLEAAFFKWALYPEPKGVSLFYLGLILEKAGLYKHAIKAYYAIVVHFPNAVGWTYWRTPWYVGQVAIAKIKYLCKKHPELKMKLLDAKINIVNGYDHDISNDIFIVNPGKLITNGLHESFLDKAKEFLKQKMQKKKIVKVKGWGRVRLVQYENGGWQLFVDDKPFVIKGITYAPTKVGQSPDDGSLTSWMEYDFNKNGKCDGPYDAFVDRNRNNKQDVNEPATGDFKLMKEMGINTIRIYQQPFKVNKELLRRLYNEYGIMVIMGDFLGKYALGSGAEWDKGTDYSNPLHQKNMLESVKKMVLEFKDEPYILMWLLGNENVYGVACNADKNPEAFFKFCNQAATLIKTLDSDHPVAVVNGDVLFLDRFAKYADEVDVFGANAYRGEYGFGAFWQEVKELAGKPAFITEYGCPAFSKGMTQEEAEQAQADYLVGAWQDVQDNMADSTGEGNAVGAIAFEYLDEWWKAYEPSFHDTKGLFTGPFPDGFMHEEWLGLCGQGDGGLSPFLRQPRKSYYAYKEIWNK
ncbi:MAG: glycoside hydrolase family 2 TIM barrel-domain containing protein [Candidatus Omnitrophica bacterium]|nr:glycoside hydrolase family 2 TIM barrel-domain containing protein [Candidatus Omnitrophota bacterium]MDD5352989.1 glycoside hydrolase family 2 TIM barrel-domain containing protein [Candidatus Omnitrophota bacterium]MDD5550588.1 glycoside hydrolase family 2 TIM barrel-domain containing protein [Candidatus Omnitrophota bacterium]